MRSPTEAPPSLHWSSLRASLDLLGGSSPDAYVCVLPSTVASIVPAAPTEPLVNVVAHRPPPRSDRAPWADVADIYLAASVERWTVWTAADDTAAHQALADAGYAPGPTLSGMTLDLHGLDTAPARALARLLRGSSDQRWRDPRVLGATNAAAHAAPGVREAFTVAPGLDVRYYGAGPSWDADTVLCSIDHEATADDRACTIAWVATRPGARRRGTARALVARALVEAAARGCATAVLQASEMAVPLYRQLGFRPTAQFALWAYDRAGEARP